jgi:hypothetical protein
MTSVTELNLEELDGVNGSSLRGWMHAIVDASIAAATPVKTGGSIYDGSGLSPGGLNGSGGGGGGTPVCPGCHSPA